MRDQSHSQYLPGHPERFVRIAGQFHAATLTASASVDLRFYHYRSPAQTLGNVAGLICFCDNLAPRNGHTASREYLLGLIFVDFHFQELLAPGCDGASETRH